MYNLLRFLPVIFLVLSAASQNLRPCSTITKTCREFGVRNEFCDELKQRCISLPYRLRKRITASTLSPNFPPQYPAIDCRGFTLGCQDPNTEACEQFRKSCDNVFYASSEGRLIQSTEAASVQPSKNAGPPIINKAFYSLVTPNSKCSYMKGDDIQLKQCDGTIYGEWLIESVSDSEYKVTPRVSLNPDYARSKNYKFTHISDGFFQLRLSDNQNQCLQVIGDSVNTGPCSSSDDQKWLVFFIYGPRFTGNAKFRILIDTNQMISEEIPQLHRVKSDGLLFAGAPLGQNEEAWNGLAGPDDWTISESPIQGRGRIFNNYKHSKDLAKKTPKAGFIYVEDMKRETQVTITMDELNEFAKTHDDNVLLLARQFPVHHKAPKLAFHIQNMLKDSRVKGLVFETLASGVHNLRTSGINAGTQYTLSLGKQVYWLLPPREGFTNDYLQIMKTAMNYAMEGGFLDNPNFFVIVAAYDRTKTGTGFIKADVGDDDKNSLVAITEWLKKFRSDISILEPASGH